MLRRFAKPEFAVRVARRARSHAPVAALALMLGLMTAGCAVSVPETTGSLPAPRGASVAFESIDGMPQGQFRKLVQSLEQEAETRNLAVVSRTVPSQYRIRGYASAQIQGKRTTISWLWDVYDKEYQRALRISGEEQVAGRRGWAAADDQMIQRIARDGMTQLAAFLTDPAAVPAPGVIPSPSPSPSPQPEQDSTPMASIEGATQQASLVSSQ